jgi:hypothetical protein
MVAVRWLVLSKGRREKAHCRIELPLDGGAFLSHN